jgi:adenylate cyclase
MDIVGFTTMSEKYTPEEIVEVLNSYFSFSSQIIRKRAGDIDKFIGDCVMATFIDAQDAVGTAKEIINNGLPRLNTALDSKGLPEINVRVGINSGKLVQGNIGSDDRKDMTVIGDVVNTASRVQEAAGPGNFLISESTLSRLDMSHEFDFFKEILLKGKTVPIKLFKSKSR